MSQHPDPIEVFRSAQRAQAAVDAMGMGPQPSFAAQALERMTHRLCEMIDILTEHESFESDSVDARLPEGSWLELKYALRNILNDKEIRA